MTSDTRIVVDTDHGPLTYLVTGTVAIGDAVVVPYGNWEPVVLNGTVAAIYPTGPNAQLSLERCGECARRGVRLSDGRWVDPYYGPAKVALKAAAS